MAVKARLDAALDDLSAALWQLRRLVDLLRFRLEEERLLEAAGGARWLPGTRREVDQVLDQLRLADLVRAVSSEELARILGTGSPATLPELAAAAPGPWSYILGLHHEALSEAVEAVARLVQECREATECPVPPSVRIGPALADFLGAPRSS
jgi:hypothetical protein